MSDWLKNLKFIGFMVIIVAFLGVAAVIYMMPGETYKLYYTGVNNATPGSKPVHMGIGSPSGDPDTYDLIRPGGSKTFTSEFKVVNGSAVTSRSFYVADEDGRVLGKVTYEPKSKNDHVTLVWDGHTLSIE